MLGRNDREAPQITIITPSAAAELLEANQSNRPLNDQHVHRIARQILDGKWRFNGDSIKIATNNDVLDGQHRLWACIESKQSIESVIVRNIDPDAFATIDTLRKPRSGSDVLALNGVANYRSTISVALQWLIRYQRNVLLDYRAPINRVENSDIERTFRDNPGIVRAAERASKLRGLSSIGLIAFFYFILTNRNPELAERMVNTLESPAGVSVNDPFFRLRAYLTQTLHKDSIMTIALMIKAANAAHENRETRVLLWRNQGSNAEDFPKLNVGHVAATIR